MRGRSLSGHFLRKYPAVQCITAQAETRLFFDTRQRDHIRALSAASGATAMRPQAARADGHNPAHQIDGKCCSVLFNELKPHGFWLAKNTVAFFNTSRSSLRMRPLTHASMCCQVIVSHAEADHSLGRGSNPLSTPRPCLGAQ